MIVAGFGFREGASEESLESAYARAQGDWEAGIFATADDKVGGLQDFARTQGAVVRAVTERELSAQEPLTLSQASISARGTGSLAEAAALAAAGPGARLLGPRAISEDRQATCALAIGAGT